MEYILTIGLILIIVFVIWFTAVYIPGLDKKAEQETEQEIKDTYPTDTMQNIQDSEKPYLSYDQETFYQHKN